MPAFLLIFFGLKKLLFFIKYINYVNNVFFIVKMS